MNNLNTVLDLSAICAVIIAGSVFVLKLWVEHFVKYTYEKNLETHKLRLQSEYDIQIERLKAELAEKHFRYSHVFERTAVAIEETYKRLLKLNSAVQLYSRMVVVENVDQEKLGKEFVKSLSDFADYYYPNKIYIPPNVAIRVDEYIQVAVGLGGSVDRGERMLKAEAGREQIRRNIETFRELSGNLSPVFVEMEREFQKLLGFSFD